MPLNGHTATGPPLAVPTAHGSLGRMMLRFAAVPSARLLLVRSVIVAGVILAVVFAFARARYGSLTSALANLRGETLAVLPARRDLGSGTKNERRITHFGVKNLGDEPATLVGGSSDCRCAIVSGLPLKAPPGETVDIEVGISFPGDPGEFSHVIVFYTDVPRQSVLSAKIVGSVVE